MVAYSFNSIFSDQVSALIKRQTVRADRKRHARHGEPLQLFCGMRTRHCRKLVDPDPVCVGVQQIEIGVNRLIDALIASIVIDGIPLDRDEIEAFARADGFAPEVLRRGNCSFQVADTARQNMGQFWLAAHGDGRFDGVLIRWAPKP
jgi:hypothetical protein